MQKGPSIIFVLISIITCLVLTITFNHKYAPPDKIDPDAQYEISYTDVADKYGEGVHIHLKSTGNHNLRITLLIKTYEPNRENGVQRYNSLEKVYLQSGKSHTINTNASKIILGATIKEVIVEPATPPCVNLTWLAILALLMFGIDIVFFIEDLDYYNIIFTDNTWGTIAVYLLSTILVTTMWMRLFMWITQTLIHADVVFRIFGLNF